jgi:hypothetical protein
LNEGLARMLRRVRAAAQAPVPPPPGREPEAVRPLRVPLPAEDSAEPVPGFSRPEECRVRVLADWLGSASPGTQKWGVALADCLRLELPDVPDAVLARVLLVTGGYAEAAADSQADDFSSLRAVAFALLGAPAVLAELGLDLELELAEEHRWR